MHFFTEVDKISQQRAVQAFGPFPSEELTRFQLCSRFDVLSNTNAYSMVQGAVLVQPVDLYSDVVNIVIKPISGKNGGYSSVDYIVYRGVNKNSLILNDELVNEGSNELVDLIWASWRQLVVDHNLNSPLAERITDVRPSANYIGWHLRTITNVIPLEKAFQTSDTEHQLFVVPEGKILGSLLANTEFSVEIVLKEPIYSPTLQNVRQKYNILEVEMASGVTLETEGFPSKVKREQVLSYLDLPVYLSLNATSGVRYRTSGVWSTVDNKDQVYLNCLQVFYNKNKVYIDTRNEVGHSLNFFRDNDNVGGQITSDDPVLNSQFKVGYGSTPVASPTSAQLWAWPIQQLSPNASSITFQYRKRYNPSPIIYLDFSFADRNFSRKNSDNSRFIVDDSLTATAAWSSPVTAMLPVVGTNQTVNHPWIIKHMVCRTAVPDNLPVSSLKRRNPLNNIFGPLPLVPSNTDNTTITLGKRWLYLGDIHNTKGVVLEIQVKITSSQAFLVALPLHYFDMHGEVSTNASQYYPTTGLGLDNPDHAMASTSTEWVFSEFGVEMKRVVANNAQTNHNITGISKTDAKSAIFLALLFTRSEYDSFALAASQTFDIAAQANYLQFDFLLQYLSGSSRIVFESRLYSGGIISSGEYLLAGTGYPNAVSLNIFGFDGLNFSSEGFSQTLAAVYQEQTYTWNELWEDVQKVEEIYVTKLNRDITTRHTVTRLRVHFYGYTDFTVEEYLKQSSEENKKEYIKQRQKGYGFNLALPNAPYWESKPRLTLNACTTVVGTGRRVPPEPLYDSEHCRIRQLYADYEGTPEVPIATIKRLINFDPYIDKYRSITDGGNTKLDIGHSLYTLDALLGGSPATSRGYRQLGATSSLDLANIIGDLTGVVATTYARFAQKETAAERAAFNWNTELDHSYAWAAPVSDILSDVDGIGLYKAWQYLVSSSSNGSVLLSQIIYQYYGTTSQVSYANRWKLFCIHENLIQQTSPGVYVWNPTQSNYFDRFTNAWTLTLYVEVAQVALGIFLAARGQAVEPTWAFMALDNNHLNYVLNKFYTNTRNALNAEQGWSL